MAAQSVARDQFPKKIHMKRVLRLPGAAPERLWSPKIGVTPIGGTAKSVAGNLFFKQDRIDPGISLDVAKENANTIVSAFNYISCDAFSPGSKDFAAGLNYLKELYQKSNFDYISCNIKDPNSNLIFKLYKIIDKEGFKIGVIGASSVFLNSGVKEFFLSFDTNPRKIQKKVFSGVIFLIYFAL